MSDESDVEMNAQEEEQELADNEDRTEEELTLDDLYTRYRVRRTCLEVRVNTHTHTHTHSFPPSPCLKRETERKKGRERAHRSALLCGIPLVEEKCRLLQLDVYTCDGLILYVLE
jgi:hypothetical protein